MGMKPGRVVLRLTQSNQLSKYNATYYWKSGGLKISEQESAEFNRPFDYVFRCRGSHNYTKKPILLVSFQ